MEPCPPHRLWVLAVTLALLSPLVAAGSPGANGFEYVSPLPGAQRVSPWNDLIIRPGSPIDPHTIRSQLLSVVGSRSGAHDGDLVLSDDSKTLVFKPSRPFLTSEKVSVRLDRGLKTTRGDEVPPLAYAFFTSASDPMQQRRPTLAELFPDWHLPSSARPESPSVASGVLQSGCDSLPAAYPPITVLTSNDPEPGAVFIAPLGPNADGHLMIVDNLGLPLFYRHITGLGVILDFKRQPNGLLTYGQRLKYKFYALDSSYAVVDSFATGNGYVTDLHDLQLLPNGHALLMSYDPEPVGMDTVVAGGNPDAVVTGLIIQELDSAKNVVFQWRSWDHYKITDAAPDIVLTDSLIDYVHGNAIEPESDGNILLSACHMNEITKIDRQTGDIIWRLGLNAVNNQFDFLDDTRGFSHQHDVRRLANGNITLFDNGNFLDPEYTKADEYQIDEQAKTAVLAWEFRDTPEAWSGYMGNVQRLEDGGTMIGWGGRSVNPKLTELHADGTKDFELGFEPGRISYRSFRFPWRTNRFVTDVDSLDFGDVDADVGATRPVTVTNTSASELTLSCLVTTNSAFTADGPTPITLAPDSSAVIDVGFHPQINGEATGRLYVRETHEDEIIAQPVTLRGSTMNGLAVTVPNAREVRLFPNRPNPFHERTIIRYELPRSGHVLIEIFDLHGRKVATLANSFQAAGRHEQAWVSGKRASGVYFCVLHADGRVTTRKLVSLD